MKRTISRRTGSMFAIASMMLMIAAFAPLKAPAQGTDNKASTKPGKLSRFIRGQEGDLGTVTGRVSDFRGSGVANTLVILFNEDTNQTRFALTNSFGQFSFGDLPLSDLYFVSVFHRRYLFLEPSRSFEFEKPTIHLVFLASDIE